MNATTEATIQAFYTANQAALDALGTAVGCPGIWFACIFYYETGGTLDPSTTNSIGAVGLNQFVPSTLAQYSSLSPSDYAQLSVADQCAIIQQFYALASGKINTLGDLYCFNFWPAAIQKNYSSSTIIGQQGGTATAPDSSFTTGTVYAANPSLDFDANGTITRGGITDGMNSLFDDIIASSGPLFFLPTPIANTATGWWADFEENPLPWAFVIIVLVFILIYFFTKK